MVTFATPVTRTPHVTGLASLYARRLLDAILRPRHNSYASSRPWQEPIPASIYFLRGPHAVFAALTAQASHRQIPHAPLSRMRDSGGHAGADLQRDTQLHWRRRI